ncbi:hypothetical protein HHK36_030897 [Tetracentron sinense]|uniref:Transmembrane protein 131-like N-terminal domain-containing protein n=1 Tax=Tetracentron sinense TaxID=13715 RepID=A0A835CZ50_TETSI|nr:hypothetical protein HHK36_030897 [Tetracentron sinense]
MNAMLWVCSKTKKTLIYQNPNGSFWSAEMENETLTTRAEEPLSMFYRRFFQPFEGFQLVLVLSCTLLWLATCGPCAMKNRLVPKVRGMQDPLDYDACGSYEDNYGASLQDIFFGDSNSDYVQGNSPTRLGLQNVCMGSEFFCFPSTLPGFLSEEDRLKASLLEVPGSEVDASSHEGLVLDHMWEKKPSESSNYGMHNLLNGRSVSCSFKSEKGSHGKSPSQNNRVDQNDLTSCRGPLLKQQRPGSSSNKSSEMMKSGLLDGSSSPHVEISPPQLDWGHKYLYVPSLTFLTVVNTCKDNILHVYEPYSTDTQFYPCESDELLLGPGEVASICFVFLPRRLGFSSAHLVVQTNSGGFLVHAKGLAIESPYGIQPLVGLDISSNGRWSKNLSLFNPFDGTIYVEEVIAWVSVCLDNTSYSVEAICRMDTFQGSEEFGSLLNVKEWLDIKSGQVGLPMVGISPLRSWEVEPHNSETIMEMDLLSSGEGKVFGAFCMQLQISSQDRTDVVIVPLEAELHGKSAYSGLTDLVLVYLEALVPCDGSETVVVDLSLKNGSPYLLSIIKISEVAENTKLFQIKYMEGLILFPGTITRIAVITYTPLSVNSEDLPLEIPNIKSNCKLLIVTNDSGSPQIEIPCQDVVHTCLRHQSDSYFRYELQPDKETPGNTRSVSLGSGVQSPSQIKLKALETAEADELVLRNWRSQGTTSGMSVLEEHEVLYPMVQVGTHYSKWITVKNPSQEPVVVQLILNSGAIIDQCRAVDEFLQPSSSILVWNESTTPKRYGFSIAETAITEAYVHPCGRALLGPIVFHPSNRCGWRSSALIRNNLSGVEWLPLRGFGGSLSLVLLEGSEPVRSLEFNLIMLIPLNISPSDLFHMEKISSACSQPLLKELYAKNTGDLPLEVKRIEISGADCVLAGFIVHSCKGFALEPGESTRLLISYQTDLFAAVVHRDLELALATGILVIPMKANLPMYMFNLCKKSLFWIRMKKFFLVVFVAAFVTLLVFCCILPQALAFGTQDELFKSEKSSSTIIRRAGKLSHMHRNQRNSRFSMCTSMDSLFRPVEEDETSKLDFDGRYSDDPGGVQEQGITAQHIKQMQVNSKRTSDAQKETALLPFPSTSKSMEVIESSASLEAPQAGNLTVKVRKERARRRRNRKGAGAGLTGILEVSSSQSGNSTPSSPLSPVTSFAPKRTWPLSPDVEHTIEARNPFTQVPNQDCERGHVFESATHARLLEREISVKYCSKNWFLSAQKQPSAPTKTTNKPVLFSSATFPCTGQRVPSVLSPPPFLASTSTIAPHSRAPGSKLYQQKTVKAEVNAGLEDEFTYDIWGNHLSGLHLMDNAEEVSTTISNASEGDSQSFFVRAPPDPHAKVSSKICYCS